VRYEAKRTQAATVSVHIADRRSFTHEVNGPLESLTKPMSDAQLESKVRGLDAILGQLSEMQSAHATARYGAQEKEASHRELISQSHDAAVLFPSEKTVKRSATYTAAAAYANADKRRRLPLSGSKP
jgi:hypothetical protein